MGILAVRSRIFSKRIWRSDMTEQSLDFATFVQEWLSKPLGLSYHYVDTPEGRERVNRAYDRLFAALMRRRSAAGDGGITNA